MSHMFSEFAGDYYSPLGLQKRITDKGQFIIMMKKIRLIIPLVIHEYNFLKYIIIKTFMNSILFRNVCVLTINDLPIITPY